MHDRVQIASGGAPSAGSGRGSRGYRVRPSPCGVSRRKSVSVMRCERRHRVSRVVVRAIVDLCCSSRRCFRSGCRFGFPVAESQAGSVLFDVVDHRHLRLPANFQLTLVAGIGHGQQVGMRDGGAREVARGRCFKLSDTNRGVSSVLVGEAHYCRA